MHWREAADWAAGFALNQAAALAVHQALRPILHRPKPNGSFMDIPFKGSFALNHYSGRKGFRPDLIVVHGMGGTLTGTAAWFNNPLARASTHLGIGSPNGGGEDAVWQFVKLEDAAGGVREDSQLKNANLRSYQLEIQNYVLRDGKLEFYIKDTWKELAAQAIVLLARKLETPRRPDRSFVIAHREADPRKVECPKGIDMDALVARAQEIWDGPVRAELASASRSVPVFVDTLASDPKGPNGYPQARVTAPAGANVRDEAGNVVEVLPFGSVQDVEGVVARVAPKGSANNLWFRKPNGLYLWTGATGYDPSETA